jgi:hypothetical protein
VPLRPTSPSVLSAGRSVRRPGLSLLAAVLVAVASGAWASASASAAVGHELREASKIVYGSTEDGGEISTVYDGGNRRANEIARTASDPERRRLFLVTRPYTDGTVRVYRVDLTDGTSAERLPEANIVARANFASTRNAAVDPKDGHLWILLQDAANVLRLIRVDPDSGAIRANVALPTAANSLQAGLMRIDPAGDRLWLSSGQYIANVPLAPARAEGATDATFRVTSLRQRSLYSAGTFSAIQASAAGVAFAHDDRDQGAGNTGPWTYVATRVPAGLLWISDQTASDLANTALDLTATPALSPDNGLSEGHADAMAVDPETGDIVQAITTPNDGNWGRIIRLARDTRTPAVTSAPGVATPSSGLFRFAGDEIWWRGQGETMVLDRTTLEPRATVPNLPGFVPADSELLLDGRLYAPVADGVSIQELTEVELPDANASPIGGRRIASGAIEWGVRQSWRQYITTGAAHGRVDLTAPAWAPDGAATGADYAYRFPAGEGVYDPENGELRLATKGGVRFTGHSYGGASPTLDVRFSDPTVIVRRDGTGVLTAAARDSEGNALGNWPFVDLDVTDVEIARDEDARTVTYTAVPTKLRPDGQSIFQGYYAAGTVLDPITFSLTYHESEAATWDPATTPQTRNGIPVDPENPNPDPDPDGTPTEPAKPGIPTVTTTTSTDVTAVTIPGRAASGPRIVVRGAQRLRRGARTAELARIACRRGPCRITAPSSVRVTVGGVAYRAHVAGPRRTRTGRTVALRATLPAGAIARMRRTGRAAVVRAQIAVTSPAGGTTRVVRRVLRGTR